MPGYRDRESIVPMDFEYDNRVGPVDSQSPFIAHAAKKRKPGSFASSHAQSADQVQKLNEGPPFGHPDAGTHSVFDSPSKKSFATPNHPKLTEPNGPRFPFSQTTQTQTQTQAQKALPQTPQNRNVWALRTPQSVVESSGGETPGNDSPAQDSDAATPDTQLALTMGDLTHGDRKSPSKRSSIFRHMPWNKSPSKDKAAREKPYSKKAENRVSKRRVKSRARQDDGDDAESPTKDVQQAVPDIGFLAKLPGALSWVEAHPYLPTVFSYWMQLLFNGAVGLLGLYIVYLLLCSVMADVENAKRESMREIMHEIAVCAADYERNGCERPPPALEALCQNWKSCKERDAYQVAGASIGARTFARIFNSFVDEISYKSMVSTVLLLLLYSWRIWFSIAYFRAAGFMYYWLAQTRKMSAPRTQGYDVQQPSHQPNPHALHGPFTPHALLPHDEHLADMHPD